MKKRYSTIALAFLITVVALATGVTRTGPVTAASPIAATAAIAGKADALLLTCMDYRLTGHTTDYMVHDRHMAENYDYVILAGASLGVNNTKYPNWGQTFWQHLDTAIALHGIHEVIIIDHRNCGAYNLFLGKDFPADPTPAQRKEETAVHKKQLDALAKVIHKKYPALTVETFLMNLDGTVEAIE